MNFAGVLELLEEWDEFPVVPSKLQEIVCEHTHVKHVKYIGVDLDTEVLRGGYVRAQYEEIEPDTLAPPYGEPEYRLKAKIYYARNQSSDWIRLVINKELLHILDPDKLRVCTAEEISQLINHLRMPRELLLAAGEEGVRQKAFVDYLSDYRALAAMVPERIRLILLEKLKQEKIEECGIARFLGIPEIYVRALISEVWPDFRRMVSAL